MSQPDTDPVDGLGSPGGPGGPDSPDCALGGAGPKDPPRLAHIAAQVPGVVYQYRLFPDGRSCFSYASERIRDIYRVTPEEVRQDASAVLRLLHPEDAERVRASIDTSARTLQDWHCQYRVQHTNGDVRWLLGQARPERLADGSTQWHGFITDVSQRLADEAELARYRAGLECLVEARTHELIAARDAAEQANRAKSDFLSSMSHELRTPMNAMLGFAQLLELDRALGPRSSSYVREILRAGQHLLELVNEVLDLARVESGRMTLSPEALRLGDLVAEALSLVQPLASARGIQLQQQGLDDQVVRADRLRLKQVLLNLLSNAIKYNRDGGTVQLQAAPGEAGMLRLSVRDSGPGIRAEELPRLFQPFARLGADSATQGPARDGAGIGLAISERLMRLMGGRIGANSEPGVGSVFWIELPSARLADAPPARTAPLVPHDPTAPRPQRNAEVLHIEDNPASLKLVQQIVARHPGLQLMTAPTGRLGLELARARRPALLLLDIHLPDIDGYEVLAQLRADPALRALQVVAVTAQALPEDRHRMLRAGFDAVLAKPVVLAELDALLAALLAGGTG